MTAEMKAEILELGETFVTLLKSPICPPEVRTAIVSHLDQVRKQLDMTNPELVRSVFSFLATTAGLPQTVATTQAQGEAVSTVLAAAAATTTMAESAKPAVPAPAAAQPMAAAAAAPATETGKSSGNLAARLAASGEEV
jgi:hypothetical protein